jgi:glycine C-acetyltransferase
MLGESWQREAGETLRAIRAAGLEKVERPLDGPQGAHIRLSGADGGEALNFCANNYLGLANHPEVVAAAHAALDHWGFGLASVRFICGTQELHRELEAAVRDFLGMEDAILFGSCFDANGGLFEALLGEEDAVISDALNHASIIDGIRLCKARRLRYPGCDMAGLEGCLREAGDARRRLIATDGVFSMDGTIAPLASICDLAEAHDALVMVDDSHAVGFLGEGGRGTHEYRDVMGRVDLLTGTFGKALGGAGGGYVAGRGELIALLRQRARPYLFSNTLAPPVAAASLKALELARTRPGLRRRLWENTGRFRAGLAGAGFPVPAEAHPIVPVMLGDPRLATAMAARLAAQGIHVIAFSFPVVPRGTDRIRVQVSAAHSTVDIDRAVAAFAAARQETRP